ncbi:MAG: ferritin family protein [Methanobacteriota archaeon]
MVDPEQQIKTILRTAYIIERRGADFYGALSRTADDTERKALFEQLAKDEMSHVNILGSYLGMYTPRGSNGADDTDPLFDDAEDLIKGNSRDIIEFSIRLEDRILATYGNALLLAVDEKVKNLLQELVQFEKTHKLLLRIQLRRMATAKDVAAVREPWTRSLPVRS